jgi:predicted ATPase
LAYQPLFIRRTTNADPDAFQPSDIGAVQLHDLRRPGVTVGFSDVGYGLSQVMPVVCQLLLAEDSLVTIEQPELHIHPALQAELADLILYSARVRRNQVLVETHSEHLALRLQRSVRAGTAFGPDMYSLVYIDAEDAGSTAQGLPLGPAGQLLSQPPEGWFPERLRELLPQKREA